MQLNMWSINMVNGSFSNEGECRNPATVARHSLQKEIQLPVDVKNKYVRSAVLESGSLTYYPHNKSQ